MKHKDGRSSECFSAAGSPTPICSPDHRASASGSLQMNSPRPSCVSHRRESACKHATAVQPACKLSRALIPIISSPATGRLIGKLALPDDPVLPGQVLGVMEMEEVV